MGSDVEPLPSDTEFDDDDVGDDSSFIMLNLSKDENTINKSKPSKFVGVQRAPVFVAVQEAWKVQFDPLNPMNVDILTKDLCTSTHTTSINRLAENIHNNTNHVNTTFSTDGESMSRIPSTLRGLPAHALAVKGEYFIDDLLRHTFSAIKYHKLPYGVPCGFLRKATYANELLMAIAGKVLPERHKLSKNVLMTVQAQMKAFDFPIMFSTQLKATKRWKNAHQDAFDDNDDNDDNIEDQVLYI